MRNSGQTLSESVGNTVTQSPPLAGWGFEFHVTRKKEVSRLCERGNPLAAGTFGKL